MSSPPLTSIRNIGIISHIDAGKTTVSERILYFSGKIHKIGEVHEGTATMDWMEQEQQRGITITASNTTCQWGKFWLNLIDTPGHIDFTIEVERSLRVLDGAVAIFSAVEGVQPQSESVWHQADRYRVPRICLINKMDRIGADYKMVLSQLEERLQARPILLQIPIGNESDFSGVIDLLSEKALTFPEPGEGDLPMANPIPEQFLVDVQEAREKIIETAADFDDSILNDFLEGLTIEKERLESALRKGVLACQIQPVFLGAALRNKGIQPLMDGVGTFLPSPLETAAIEARNPKTDEMITLPCDPKGPFCAMAFKVLSDEGRKLTYLRLYSGTLKVGENILNCSRQVTEKAARLFRMHSHKRERLQEVFAGDIVTATGLKEALTGDTLCAPDFPLILAGLNIPAPVVSIAVETRGVEDREKLLPSLEKLQWEDPTFKVKEDEETGQTILSGMGELHLEVVTNRLEKEFGIPLKTGRPQVVYRETIQKPVKHHEKFQIDIEGKAQGGEILFQLKPLERGSGVQVKLAENEKIEISEEFCTSLKTSFERSCEAGIRSGYPLTDVEITIMEAPAVSGFTTDVGLMAAAQKGFSTAASKASPTLLEPIMSLEIVTPSEYAGKVMSSLQQKRGRVEGFESRGNSELIKAQVPLSEMFGYMTELRSATKGRGTFTMEFSHFSEAPKEDLERFGFL
ncbi:MAG: elongation factor G [Deltaproteobacteria bacterium]|nr:elongation factor G [Deltaproteobacteria bacterium]